MSDAVLVRAIEAAEQGDLTSLRELHAQGLLASLQDEQQQQRQQERRQQQQQQAAWSSLASPVHHAARAGSLTALRFLVGEARLSARIRTGPARASPAHDAAARGQLACLRYLLEDGACDSEERDGAGCTVLHVAARFGCTAVVNWLLQSGRCDPRAVTEARALPIHYSAVRGDPDSTNALLQAAPDTVNARTREGVTPVYLACQEGHLFLLQRLVEKWGADVTIQSEDGMTPLHAAAQNGHTPLLAWLTEFTVLNLNHVDGDGVSPLHFAAGGGHCSTMDWLLAHGAKNQVDLTGCYPLHDAADNGHIKCCEILLMHEADVNAKDSWGYTPVDLAEENGHTECVEYLLFQRHNSCEQGATNRKPGRRVTFKLTEGDEIPGSEMDDYEAAELPKLSDLLVAADTDVESSIDIPEPESEGERDFDVISITAEEHSYVPPQAPPPPSHPQINRYDGASLYKTLPCKSGVKKNNLKASSSLNFELIEELKAGKSLKPTQNSNGRLITFVEWNEAKKHEISDCSSNAEAGVGVTPDEEKSCSSESSNAPVTHTSNEETPSKPLNDVSPPSNLNCDFKSEISPANVIIIPLHPDKKKYN
ncbi:uncharacterized protein LOC116939494 isoform X1 [Petromyzon marinus]|uniref:uncharacterized protein LOC116939494 isoform X1 n=1 Tax=Petromyzon marinus TaxID=7757 RepID=UPI003F7240F5